MLPHVHPMSENTIAIPTWSFYCRTVHENYGRDLRVTWTVPLCVLRTMVLRNRKTYSEQYGRLLIVINSHELSPDYRL